MTSAVENDLEADKRIDAAVELLHQAGATVETRAVLPERYASRDWDTEDYLDQWVGRYMRNVAEDYKDIRRAPHIGPLRDALAHDAKGQPMGERAHAVAVVGAGPSLDANAEELRDFPGLIVACDRAAKALTARGIRVDLAVCVDPRPVLLAEMLDYPENRDQTLVLSVLCDPEVARVWRGRKLYMSTIHEGTQFFDRILPALFPGMPGTFACGNVGNTGVQLAEWMGAKKIVLVGQDYAYTGGRVSCDDWVRFPDGSWQRFTRAPAAEAERLAQRTGRVTVDGVETYPAFVTYRRTLEEMVKTWGLDVVNATGAGLLTNFPVAALSDVIAQLREENYAAAEARTRLDKALGGLP